jgi:hypothetical protein
MGFIWTRELQKQKQKWRKPFNPKLNLLSREPAVLAYHLGEPAVLTDLGMLRNQQGAGTHQ